MLAEAEKQNEELRLKGYQATLDQRDKQQARDHEFRKKRLNHATTLTTVVVIVAIVGVVTGIFLQLTREDSQIGGYILIASAIVLVQLLGIKTSAPSSD